ncbi:SLC13 family permease [Aliifodinibius sp. S!AR15-10]|uniref:SLC13 family permease n=1 Tax=Aliifodinibius sp. S!AR15-10 TaxID=2950437 RepID=UPI00285E6F29|nr:SLC13 family permease [Aliifodinibius sp. S!AR15-10]MDR8391967.1 SLC13 family permease [Aliifodinibius sp. S!AR15-10]
MIAQWIVLVVIMGCFLVLVTTTISADIVFLCGLAALIVLNVVPPEEALSGFANQGMLTVAALYVVAAGLKETGAIQVLVNKIIGTSRTVQRAQLRLMTPVIFISSFINNTPVVASFIPAVQDWSRKKKIPASKLLIPLSYASILGGTCTLIGTSTNLVVNGLLIDEGSTEGIGFFEIAYIGVPCAIIGFIYIMLASGKLLPDRGLGLSLFKDPREYTIEMIVEKGSQLSGKSLEEAGIYGLPGLFIMDIYRDDEVVTVTNPGQLLKENDRIVFAGILDSVVDLQHIKGLKPATDQIFKLDSLPSDRVLVEAVISPTNPLNNRTIKEGRFRDMYDGVVLAIARNGERIRESVGDIKLKTGDTLLLETLPSFLERYKNSSDYSLISNISYFSPRADEKARIAWVILVGMVVLATSGMLSMFQASFLAAAAMVLTRCCRPQVAKENVDWAVLIVIAASIGIGNSLEVTGAAEMMANQILDIDNNNPYFFLATTYLATTLLTEIINNNTAAVLIFPIAISIAASLQLNYEPFVIVIMMAGSASFATPIGYQTNLMVYGPGGYKFTDFAKIGLPLNVIVGIITVLLVPLVWPF